MDRKELPTPPQQAPRGPVSSHQAEGTGGSWASRLLSSATGERQGSAVVAAAPSHLVSAWSLTLPGSLSRESALSRSHSHRQSHCWSSVDGRDPLRLLQASRIVRAHEVISIKEVAQVGKVKS